MKIRSRAMRGMLVAALAIAAVFVVVSPALASFLEDEAKYSSSTNPDTGGLDVIWRWGWGNSPVADMNVTQIPADDFIEPYRERMATIGMLYGFHQMQPNEWYGDVPLAQVPDWTSPSLTVRGADLVAKFDVSGITSRQGWTSYTPGAKPGEGLYRVTTRFYNQFRSEAPTATDALNYGIDFTPPLPVDNLTSGVDQVNGVGSYTESTWRDLRWTPKAYDALSGVGGFEVKINGEVSRFAMNVAPDPAYEPYAQCINPFVPMEDQLSHLTIEGLAPGKNDISVVTVDRATNRSVPRVTQAYVDPDTPTIKYLKPANLLAARIQTFSVDATDKAGISKVSYYIDNVLVGTVTQKPYDLGLDLTNYTQGQHTLKVVAEDMIGFRTGPWIFPHTAEVVKTITIDNKAPSLTINSAGPGTFYPRKREGYKDNFVMNFTTNEPGTAYMTVYNANGKVYRQISKAVTAGTTSLSWDGKAASGSLAEADFKVRIAMYDAAGNWRASDKYTAKVRFTELVRVSANQVKVVQR